jgi:hemerythrin
MALVKWDDGYSVKVKLIDDQHKVLFNLINDLHDAMKLGKSKEVISQVLTELTKYTTTHFTGEERYMEKFNYPEIASHKKLHAEFIVKLGEFKKSHEEGKLSLSMEVTKFLVDWLVVHINGTDKKYTKCFLDNGLV